MCNIVTLKNNIEATQSFLEAHPIYVSYSGKLPYQVYGGLLSYLMFQFLTQEHLSKVTVHLIIMKEELVNARSSVAASLIESRILGNAQIVDGYKCPIENSLASLLSHEWPEANSIKEDNKTSLMKDLTKCGFIKPINQQNEIELNILNEIMKTHDA